MTRMSSWGVRFAEPNLGDKKENDKKREPSKTAQEIKDEIAKLIEKGENWRWPANS